jgi:uncharacterized protein DUF6328
MVERSSGRTGSGEDERERINRELIELLNELRVALPGVQVLFAFLLAVPFSNGWAKTSTFQRDIFFGTLICTTVSAVLLIAPSAYHRLHFRQGNKLDLLLTSNRLTIAGLVFLAAAMVGAVTLVTDVLYEAGVTVGFGLATALLFAAFWVALPLYRRARLDDD